MRSVILAAAAVVPLLFTALPAEAGDWRRHHYRNQDVIVLPGITLQLGPRYVAPPRYSHDRRPQWHRKHGWQGRHHVDRRHRHHGRHERAHRGGHRRWHH